MDDLTLGGLPTRPSDAAVRRRGLRQDLLRHDLPGQRRQQIRRTRRVHEFRGTRNDLAANVHSLGFDIDDLIARKKLVIDYVRIERAEIEESGEYDLEGLFVRLGHAIDTVGAKRVVLDTIEALFSGLADIDASCAPNFGACSAG